MEGALDALALAGTEVGVIFTAFAIWGGMMWGKPVWGVYWQWEDPRLTTTALLLALYVGYLLLRRLTDDPARRAANIKRALDAELYFYGRIFGFELTEPVEPVEIENLGL